MKKTYPYSLVADYFIAWANETQTYLSNLKLQKLVYYAQVWTLVLLDRELIKEDFQAWVHGPVIPTLFKEYSYLSFIPIIREDLKEGSRNEIEKQFEQEILKVLEEVEQDYFWKETCYLEVLVKQEEPWRLTRNGIPKDEHCQKIIPKKLMIKYYSKFVEEVENEE
jgi:uncharacterized phage-associated protein